MRRFATFLLTFILCWTVVWAANATSAFPAPAKAADWKRYTPSGEEFSVIMPKPPGVAEISRPPRRLVDLKPGVLYTAYEDGTAYIALSFDNASRQEDLQVFTSEFPQYGVFNAGATFERDLALNGFKGKQYRVKSEKTDIAGIVHFYQTRRHVYIFEAVGDARSQPAIERFLASVALGTKAKAKDIMSLQADRQELQRATMTPPPNNAMSPAATTPTPEQTFSPRDVTRKAILITRPEPQYTEPARKNQIAGTVVIKAVFSSSGAVTNIRVVSGLPYGLTEKAIAAARQLTFIPATKDGRFVSQFVQIEYNFNLY